MPRAFWLYDYIKESNVKYWQEVSNPEPNETHKTLGTTSIKWTTWFWKLYSSSRELTWCMNRPFCGYYHLEILQTWFVIL